MSDTTTQKQIKKALDLIGRPKTKDFGNKTSKISKSGLIKKANTARFGT